jgi:hypothetical protein
MNNKNTINLIIICSVIFLCAFSAQAASLPKDPNNAALLYYQAFVLLPEPDYFLNRLINRSTTEEIYEYLNGAKFEPDKETKKIVHDLELKMKGISPDPNKQLSPHEKALYQDEDYKERRLAELDFFKELIEQDKKMQGVDPNKVIREYLKKCGPSIALAQAASEITDCDWGILYSQGFDFHLPPTDVRKFTKILRIEALRLAADGNYRAALERCLMVCGLARHISDEDMIMHSISLSIDGIAFECIKYILESMPSDADTLTWLKDQLTATPGASESLVPALKIDYELVLQRLLKNPKTVARIRGRFVEEATYSENKDAEEKFKNLTNEELIPLIREFASVFFDPFFKSVLRAIKSKKPYDQIYAELELLIYKLKANDAFYIITPFYDLTHIEIAPRLYQLHVNLRTIKNAIEAAIEIYLVVAKIGQLPESLPDGLPKDPYTLEDFIYEITDDGFALRCQGEEFLRSLNRKLEFKVKK